MLYLIFIIIHIVTGSIGLLSGTVAAIAAKGKSIHIKSGWIFFYSMLATAVSAMVISFLPNHNSIFLFAVGGFTFYMVVSGTRIVHIKKQLKTKTNPINIVDYAISVFGICFAMYLIFQGLKRLLINNTFGIVPLVFGIICLGFVVLDARILLGKATIKKAWIYNHITRMMGSLIASYTAFLVVNITIQQGWILWLLPTAIGSVFISYFIKKYVAKAT
jgi:uncharacterized membrane protein